MEKELERKVETVIKIINNNLETDKLSEKDKTKIKKYMLRILKEQLENPEIRIEEYILSKTLETAQFSNNKSENIMKAFTKKYNWYKDILVINN